jgi:hypothetical protein
MQILTKELDTDPELEKNGFEERPIKKLKRKLFNQQHKNRARNKLD